MWLGRIRNVLTADTEAEGLEPWRVLLAIGFVALTGIAGAALVWAMYRPWPSSTKQAVWASVVLAVSGIVTWVVRGLAIAGGDHSLGFKAVHTVLALITIGLGGLVVISARHLGTFRLERSTDVAARPVET